MRYFDADTFDALNDDRAEASIGTGNPVNLTDYIRQNLPVAASLDDAARQPAEHQAPSAPAPMTAISDRAGGNGAAPIDPPTRPAV